MGFWHPCSGVQLDWPDQISGREIQIWDGFLTLHSSQWCDCVPVCNKCGSMTGNGKALLIYLHAARGLGTNSSHENGWKQAISHFAVVERCAWWKQCEARITEAINDLWLKYLQREIQTKRVNVKARETRTHVLQHWRVASWLHCYSGGEGSPVFCRVFMDMLDFLREMLCQVMLQASKISTRN